MIGNVGRIAAQRDKLAGVLREARLWVEANTAPVRALSPAAAAPGEAMLAKIDAVLAETSS